jgi:hypothetical protein
MRDTRGYNRTVDQLWADVPVLGKPTPQRWATWIVAAMSAALGFLAGVAFVVVVVP